MRAPVLLAPAALLLWAPAVLASGDGSFEAPLAIQGILNPVSVAAGDFDRDGKLDLAAVGAGGAVQVWLQDPARRDIWRQADALRFGVSNFHLRAADLDSDGDDDLAVADPGAIVHVVLSMGDGAFRPPIGLSEARGSRSVAIGDLNGDRKLDIASGNHGFRTVTVHAGGGGGAFSHLRTINVTGEPHAVEALDYDGDGRLDLAVGVSDHGLFLLRGIGDGQFQEKPVTMALGCVEHFVTADFNGDGRPDLVTACYDSLDAAVGINQGDGAFVKTLDDLQGLIGLVPAVGDFDGDGKPDVAIAHPTNGRIAVHLGKGDGTFLPPAVRGLLLPAASYLISRDLDADGRADLVAAEPGGARLTVLWGREDARLLAAGSFPALPGPMRALAVGHLNRDGLPDLFISLSQRPEVYAVLGPVAGETAPQAIEISTAGSFGRLEAADLDGDGVSDLLGVSETGGQALVAFLDEAGGVKRELALAAGSLPRSIQPGRIVGDASLDLAVACAGSNHIALFLAVGGGGSPEPALVPTVRSPEKAVAGDLDGDARADLAVTGQGLLAVHWARGGGSFEEPALLPRILGARVSDLAVAEVTGDSIADFLACESETSAVLLFRGTPGRSLVDPIRLSTDRGPRWLVVLDLDGNGLLDIATANIATKAASVLLNHGAQGFAPALAHSLPFSPLGLRIADLDLDGALDLAPFGSSGALVLRGWPALHPPGLFRRQDADADGRINVTDVIALLGRLVLGGPPLVCPDAADANDDGVLNITDPIAMVSWLFLGGSPAPPPGPRDCGEDHTPDGLPCGRGCP